MREEFQTGVEDSRSQEELVGLITARLDLFEVLLLTTYVLKKYSDDSVNNPEDEGIEIEKEEDRLPTAVDLTLNLDNDFFRALRIDKPKEFHYTFICQIDFDNVVVDKVSSEKDPTLEKLIERIKSLGEGNQKAEAEKHYLYNGGKGPTSL